MDFFNGLTMVGGLALFLYGMKTMGDALSKMAGGKLEGVLEKMTSNPLKAVLLGAGVTAVIQSSSATTVMVVGFVNSGIMKLSQAVYIIMGANIGTTVTSWILSLAGIEGTNFWLKLMKPSSFSPVLALIGIILIMFVKDNKKKDIGTIMIGFAILMFGMETMSGAVKPLANVPEFTSLFTAFENPILGMAVGAILTAIIQSSSASVGILQAMCMTGSVTFGAAIPVIMGQNIGTCVTALLSGIGASKNARRASLVHLYFNLIGTALFMVVFYSLNTFMKFSFLSTAAGASDIAVIHSLFNICATIVLMPFGKWLEKLAILTIPVTEDENKEVKINMLDERFLESPAFAVAQCKSAVVEMAKMVEKAMVLTSQLVSGYDETIAKQVVELEYQVDMKEDELSIYLTRLSAKELSERDSKLVAMYGKWISDLERISDYLKSTTYVFRKLHITGEKFSDAAMKETETIMKASKEIVENTIVCICEGNLDMALSIDPLADVISNLKQDIRRNHNERLVQGTCSVELGMSLSDIVTNLDRVGRHCSNIAEETIAHETDKYALHEYARSLKEGNESYKDLLSSYKERFSI